MNPGRPPLLALLAALLLGCPARERGPQLGPLLEACPERPTDEVLADLRLYVDCPLPPAVLALVRPDYADDERRLPDPTALRRYEGKVPLEAFTLQLERIVSPDGSLLAWIELDRAAGLLRPDPVLAPDLVLSLPRAPRPPPPPGRLQEPLELARPFRAGRQAELRRAARPERPFGPLKVAIDPGHFGGELAAFEQRELRWGGYAIREGDLSLRTALELRRKLEAKGVEVLLTRDGPGPGRPLALPSYRPFAERLLRHLSQDPAYRALESGLSDLERRRLRTAVALFAVRKQVIFETLRERMEAANAWGPDLFVSVHYNASNHPPGTSYPQALLAMVKGKVEAPRLYNPYYRQRALRDAFEIDEVNASAHLGAHLVRRMSLALQLPIVEVNPYPDHLPLLRADGSPSGVDAWNGVLFRYAEVPAVLTEGPHMDERDEMPRLDAALRAPLHQPGTRTERYAEGLAEGISDWAARWLSQERNDFGSDL